MTMRTLAILLLTLFTLDLSHNTTVEPAKSAQNGQNSSSARTVSSTETQTVRKTTPPLLINHESTTVPTTGRTNATTPTASSQSPPPPTSESRSHTNSTQRQTSSSPSLNHTQKSLNKTTAYVDRGVGSKTVLFIILLLILLAMLLAGCIHSWWTREPTQDHSTPRLLLSMRERLRAGINTLGGRIGGVLRPGDDEEEEEEAEGKQGDVEEGGHQGDSGSSSEEKDARGEQSDSSDDYSSLEGKDLRQMALSRQENETKKQSEDEDEEEEEDGGSAPGDGRQSPAQGQEVGRKEGGLEETALIDSPTEQDDNAQLCDETVF